MSGSSLLRRLFGERRLNGIALFVLTAVATGAVFGARWLHGRQIARQSALFVTLADEAEQRGDLGAASEQLERYCRLQPRDASALCRWGLLLKKSAASRSGEAKAAVVLQDAIREEPSNVEVRKALVDLAVKPGFDEICDPIPHLEKLTASLPNDAEYCNLLGQQRVRTQEYAKADEEFREAIKRSPKHIDSYVRRARLLRNKLNDGKGGDQLIDGLVTASTDVSAKLAAAQYWNDAGEPSKRAKLIEEALRQAPLDADVLLAAGAMYLSSAPPDVVKARDALRRGIASHPERFEFYRALASVEANAGDLAAVKKVLRAGLEKSRDRTDLLFPLAEALLASGDTAEAAATIEKLRAAKVATPLTGLLEARLAIVNTEWLSAARRLETLGPLLVEWPQQARQAMMLLGTCYEQLGDYDRQQAVFRRAVGLDARDAEARIGLARALGFLNRYDEAISIYSEIVAQAPQVQASMAQLAVLRELAKKPAARNWAPLEKTLADFAAEAAKNKTAASLEADVVGLRVEILLAENRPAQARDLLLDFRKRNPRAVQGWTYLALAYTREQKLVEAMATLREARTQFGDTVDLRLAEANVLCGNGLPKDTAPLDELAKNTAQFKPADFGRLLQGLADARLRAGDRAGAAEICEQLVKVRPNDLRLNRLRFDLALRLDDEFRLTQALAALERVDSEKGPSAVVAKALFLVRRYEKTKEANVLDEASLLLADAVQEQSSWAMIPLAEARIAELRNSPSTALEKYQRAVGLGENDPQILRRLIGLLYERRRFAEANAVLAKLESPGEGTPFLRLAAEVALRGRNPGQALTLAGKAVSEDSKDYRDLIWLGQINAALKRDADAEKSFRRANELAPQSPESWVALVQFLKSRDRSSEAEELIPLAITKLSDGSADLALARCYDVVGRRPEAQKRLQAALKRAPNDVSALRASAEFHLSAAEFNEAEAPLEQIVAQTSASPSDAAWAKRTLAVVLGMSGNPEQSVRALRLLGVLENGVADAPSKLSPEDVRTQAFIFALQPSTKRRREAIRLLEGLSLRQPLGVEEELLLVQLLDSLGDWQVAKRRLQSLARNEGESNNLVLGYLVRGLLTREENVEDAERWLKQLEKAQPESPTTTELHARVLFAKNPKAAEEYVVREFADRQQRPDLAAGLLDQIGLPKAAEPLYRKLAADRSRPEFALVLIRFLGKHGAAEEGMTRCRELRGKLPPELLAQVGVECLYAAQKLPTRSAAEFDAWLSAAAAHADRSVILQLMLAALRVREGRYDDAVSSYRAVLKIDPRNGPALNNLSYLLAFHERKPKEAEKLLDEAIAQQGSLPELLDTRGSVRLEMGKTQAAIDDLRESSLLAPKGVKFFHLARALAAAGNVPDARESWKDAGKLNFTEFDLQELERPYVRRLQEDLARRN